MHQDQDPPETCCETIELKTVCLICGFISLFYWGGMVAVLPVAAYKNMRYMLYLEQSRKDNLYDYVFSSIFFFNILMRIIFYIIFVANLAFVVVLLIGLIKNKPKCLEAYLIYFVIYLVVLGILGIYAATKVREYPIAIFETFVFLVHVFVLWIVRRMYRKMK